MNPKEARVGGPDEENLTCPTCGMDEKDWSKRVQGYHEGGLVYCCKGCAEGTDCTCINK